MAHEHGVARVQRRVLRIGVAALQLVRYALVSTVLQAEVLERRCPVPRRRPLRSSLAGPTVSPSRFRIALAIQVAEQQK